MAQTARPLQDDLNEWDSTVTAASVLQEETADGDTSDIAGPVGTSNVLLRVRLQPLVDPGSNENHVLAIQLKAGRLATGMRAMVRLKADTGATIAEFTLNNLSETYTTYNLSLTGEQAQSISNYGSLFVEVEQIQIDPDPPNNNRRGIVYWAQLETTDPPPPDTNRRGRVYWAELQAGGDLLESGVHPRAFVLAEDLPALRTTLKSPTWLSEFSGWVSRMDTLYPLVTGATNNGNNTNFWYHPVNYAFLGMLDPSDSAWTASGVTFAYTKAQYQQKALDLMRATETRLAAGDKASGWPYRFALAYDWLAADLSSTVKNELLTILLGRNTKAPGASENPFDDQPSGERAVWPFLGLVAYGDATALGEANAGNVDAAARWATRTTWIAGSGTANIDAQDWLAGTHGGHSQGMDYSDKENYILVWLTHEAIRVATEMSQNAAYSGRGSILYQPKWLMHGLVPQVSGATSKRMHRFWKGKVDLLSGGRNNTGFYFIRGLGAVDATSAGIAQYGIEQGWFKENAGVTFDRQNAVLFNFLPHANSIPTAVDPATVLPLIEHYDPFGWIVARTMHNAGEWLSTDDSYLSVWGAEWSRQGTYWHTTQGNVVLERKGAGVLLESGTDTHQSHHGTSWAGNAPVFVPPTASGNDRGGQRKTTGGLVDYTVSLQRGTSWDVGGIRRYRDLGGAVYARMDLTRSYNSTSLADSGETTKISRYSRSVLYVLPTSVSGRDYLFVCDRFVPTADTIEPRIIWWPCTDGAVAPTMNASTTAGQDIGPFRRGTTLGKVQIPSYGATDMAGASWTTPSSQQAWLSGVYSSSGWQRTVTVGGTNSSGQWGKPNLNSDIKTITALSSVDRGTGLADATATVTAHGYATGDTIQIGQAAPEAFNLTTEITVVDANTFTYLTIGGSAAGTVVTAAPADGFNKIYACEASHEWENPYGEVPIGNAQQNAYTEPQAEQVGRYHLETIPVIGVDDNYTLVHVLEAADTASTQSTTSGNGSGTTHVVARCGSLLVAFAKTSVLSYSAQIGSATTPGDEGSITSANLQVSASGSYTLYVCDLEPGATYTMSVGSGGSPGSETQAADAAGVYTTTVTTVAANTTITVTKV